MAARQSSVGFASAPNNGNHFHLTGADVYAICIAVPVIGGLAWTLTRDAASISNSWRVILVWLSAMIVLNLLDLPNSHGLKFAPDLPVISVLAVFFSPGIAACIGFVGSCDKREFTGAIRPTTTLFNRSQVALSLFIASLAAHSILGSDRAIQVLAAQTTVALVVSLAFNYLMVDVMSSLRAHVTPLKAVSMMSLGRSADFSATILAWATMAFLLSAAYEVASGWAVIAFCVPAVMGRQVLERSQQLIKSEAALEDKQEAVRELSELTGIERRDERLMISSHLHDDVLPPLFQVSLLCSVVHEDLANGMLLSLEEDVPALREACDHASVVLRRFINDLRNSPLGSRGLPETITSLVRELQRQSQAKVTSIVSDVGDPPETIQLALYQVVKEGLLNAVHHSQAKSISLEMSRDEDYIRFGISDDGVGFDPASSKLGHFGLLIMKERTEAVGGTLYIDSAPGEGTIVAARFPLTDSR